MVASDNTKATCISLYGNQATRYVDMLDSIPQGLLIPMIAKSENIENLLGIAGVANVTNNDKILDACTQRILAINPSAINTYFPSGLTLPHAILSITRHQQKLFSKILQKFGNHLDINKCINGTNPETMHFNGTTMLFLAAQEGHIDACTSILKREDVTVSQARADGTTPFAIAAEFGHLEVMQKINDYALSHNQDIGVNNHSRRGITPLISAIENAPDFISKALIEKYGASVHVCDTETNTSPIFFAASSQKLDLVSFLIGKGADCNHYTEQSHNILHALVWNNKRIPEPNFNSLKSFFDITLGNNHALWKSCSDYGTAPLHDAIESGYYGPRSIKKILDRAQIFNVPNYQNVLTKTGRSALHTATALNKKDIAEILLDHNIDTSILDQEGYTAIHIANQFGYDEIENLIQNKIQKSQEKKKVEKKKNKARALAKKKVITHTIQLVEKCLSCGTHSHCTCTSSSSSSRPEDTLPIDPIASESRKLSQPPTVKQKQQFTTVNSCALIPFINLSAPDGVCAMRNIATNKTTRNILIGYKQKDTTHNYSNLIYCCNQDKENDELDIYHSTHRAFDQNTLNYGIKVHYNQQKSHQALLEKYRIYINPGNTAYILPGRITSPAYDPKIAPAHKGKINQLGNDHDGAFVIITIDANRGINATEKVIIHKCFHPSEEQRAFHAATQRH